MTEELSERVKRSKKTTSKDETDSQVADQTENSPEQESTTNRLHRIEAMLKELIAQQACLKRRVESIAADTDDIHLGMDALYNQEESSKSDDSHVSDEIDWQAELQELRAEEIEQEEDESGSEDESLS
jgi:hypothetical protein